MARIYAGVRKLEAHLRMPERGGLIIALSADAELIDMAGTCTASQYLAPGIRSKRSNQFSDEHPGVTLAVQRRDLMVADGYDASLTVTGPSWTCYSRRRFGFFSHLDQPACMAGLGPTIPGQLDEIEALGLS